MLDNQLKAASPLALPPQNTLTALPLEQVRGGEEGGGGRGEGGRGGERACVCIGGVAAAAEHPHGAGAGASQREGGGVKKGFGRSRRFLGYCDLRLEARANTPPPSHTPTSSTVYHFLD